MDSNEFWCRAFLAAMGDYADDADACEEAADGALRRAQRRGMVTAGDAQVVSDYLPRSVPDALTKPERVETRHLWRLKSTGETFGVWDLYAPGNVAALRYRLSDGHVRKMDLATSVLLASDEWEFAGVEQTPDERPAPEAVEFTAERDGDIWTLSAPGWTRGVQVRTGGERYPFGPLDTLRVQWGETCPPKPIKVWIEKGGA